MRTHGPDCRLFDSEADLSRWLDTPDGGSLWGRGDPAEYVRDNFVGTVEQVAEKVQGYVDAGCAEFVLWFRDYPSSGESRAVHRRGCAEGQRVTTAEATQPGAETTEAATTR